MTLAAWAPLTDRTAESGLEFVHDNGMSGSFYMPENMGAGGALVDADGDGDLDLFLVQGTLLGPDAGTAGGDRLYRNDGPGSGNVPRFVDVTARAGLGGGYGMGAATGDVDGDGRVDLYVTRFGSNQLLLGLGGARFEDVTAAANADDPRWSVPAVFFDFDGDGRLDLFVGNYVDWSYAAHRPCVTTAGARDYCQPSVYAPVPDRLLRNVSGEGGVRFADVTREAGLTAAFGRALGAAAADFDGDGLLDLYVANDGSENQLWHNRGDGTFEDVALLAGCAVDEAGAAQASMGVVAEDLDGDGDVDLLLSHLGGETHTFYRNDGRGSFDDFTARSGLGPATLEATGFGIGAADLDGDGILDLVSVSGAVSALEALAQAGDPFPYSQPNQLFRGLGGGRFALEASPGPAFETAEVSRGALFGDLDNDGDTDVVVTNNHGPARLLLGVAPSEGAWIGARVLVGVPGRDALGARVGLETAGETRWRWRRVATDGSYASASDPRVLFRLGRGETVRALRVVWPGGEEETWEAPEPGRYHTLRRGEGRANQR